MDENSNEFGAFLAGFVIGGLVGAATALILAPQSGSETRAQIANKGRELRDTSVEHVHQARERADEYRTMASEHAVELSHAAQERARIVLDSGKKQTEGDESDSSAAEGDAPAAA